MPYSFTPTMKPFVITNLYESLREVRPAKRAPNTFYPLGSQVVNNSNRYMCIQAGTTSSGTGPTDPSGSFLDGTTRWLGMGQDAVKDGDINSNLYISIGKQDEWTDPANPDLPDVSYDGEKEALENATVFIRLDASNLRLGIKNSAWATGTVYSQYDPTANQLNYPTPHYCIIGNTFVYKCLDNNNFSESIAAPSGTSTSLIETADGYVWKYIGRIPHVEQFDFSTSSFVPVPTGTSSNVQGEISTFTDLMTRGALFPQDAEIAVQIVGDGSGASAAARTMTSGDDKAIVGIYASAGGSGYTSATAIAWDEAAVGSGALIDTVLDSGSIDSINVTMVGSNYVDAVVLIVGDGTGAAASANVVNGQVTSVTVDEAGSGYTWARAYIVPGTSGAVAKAVLSPRNGHGSNIITELGVNALLISTKLTPALSDYIPTEPLSVDGSFRQIALVSGIQGDSGSDRNAEAYLGKAHEMYDSATNLNKYDDGSGYVLYINNIASIVHTSSQEEVIKISVSL